MAGPLSSAAAAAGDDSLSNSTDLHVWNRKLFWNLCVGNRADNRVLHVVSFPAVEANAEYYIKKNKKVFFFFCRVVRNPKDKQIFQHNLKFKA